MTLALGVNEIMIIKQSLTSNMLVTQICSPSFLLETVMGGKRNDVTQKDLPNSRRLNVCRHPA